MMVEIRAADLPTAYQMALKEVLDKGEIVSPRGQQTREISPLITIIENPQKRVIPFVNRQINPLLSLVQMLWYFQGRDDVEMPSFYAAQLKKYANHLTGKFDGAYGPRIVNYDGKINQLDAMYLRLSIDKDSRRALMTIYDPTRDFLETSVDVPCNFGAQAMIRNGKLDWYQFIRSQDLFWGYSYDLTEFSLMQAIMAGWLHLDVGKFTNICTSAHLYKKDWEAAERIIAEESNFYAEAIPLDARMTREETQTNFPFLYAVELRARTNSLSEAFMHNELRDKEDFVKTMAAMLFLYSKYKHTAEKLENYFKFFPAQPYDFKLYMWDWLKQRNRI